MTRMLILLLLTVVLGLGAALAQGDATGTDHDTHGHDTHEHDTHEHDGVDLGAGSNQFELGDHRYALLPLIARREDGYRATLVLALVAGGDMATMTAGATPEGHDHDAGEGATTGGDDHAEGEENRTEGEERHSEDEEAHATGEEVHSEGEEDHAEQGENHDHAEGGVHLTAALLDPSGAVAALDDLAPSSAGAVTSYSLAWFDGLDVGSFDGVWRLSVAHGDLRVEVPISIVSATSGSTEVVAVFAPAPSLSGAGLTETFVYAYDGGEVVHAAMSVRRAMAGMQHATDDEQLALVHDHFTLLADVAPVGEAMANRSPLDFAMAGSWDLTVTIAGERADSFVLAVDVLAE